MRTFSIANAAAHFSAVSSVVSGPSPVSTRKTASSSAGSVALAFSLIVWWAPGFYAVTVRANWRLIFRFHDGHAEDVDYVDYH